jgi:CubicO group peptidase (beta-lactamase class C family)
MTETPDALATDPARLGLMQGFPPAPDKTLDLLRSDSRRWPNTRWSFSHQREMTPTTVVRRGPGAASVLPYALRDDLDAVAFTSMDGQAMDWGQSLAANYTDGIVILHKGAVIYERYLGALEPQMPHLAFSVTKSFVGLLAALLQAEGLLDPEAFVPNYVPELAGTAYGDATVRQVMDMTIGVKYSELYTDPKADVWAYSRAAGMSPLPPGYDGPRTIFAFLQGLQKEGQHGQAFAYKTCNTEVLSWVIQRITGQSFASLVSDRIWQKIGAEEDAYVQVDSIAVAMAGGGLNTTLRDLARVGEMMRLDGVYNGQQILPRSVVDDIRGGADREHFAKAGVATLPGWSYRNMWWVSHNNLGAYSARGIHGQALWIAPAADLIIARYASHPIAGNGNSVLDKVSLPAYQALAEHVMARG